MALSALDLERQPRARGPHPGSLPTEVLGGASLSGVWVMITPRGRVGRMGGEGCEDVESSGSPGRDPRSERRREARDRGYSTWPPALPFERALDRARSLDTSAISLLYQRFLPVVYRYTMARVGDQHAAEDVTSETFFAMVESIATTRATDELGFAAWLLGIARNKIAMHFRALRSHPEMRHELTEDAHPFTAAEEADPLAVITARESWSEVVAALNLLTEEQRAVVLYRCILGYSTDDVSRMLEKQPGTIRALQFRALASLQRHLNATNAPQPLIRDPRGGGAARREGRKGNASRR